MKPSCLLSLLLLSFPCAGQTGSVQGTVLTSTGRQPVRKASVTIISTSLDHSYAIAITDAEGHFRFTGIPQGTYRILASRAGFLTVPYGSSSPDRPLHFLELAKGQARTGITLTLAPVSTISGKVFDADGDSVTSVQVELFKKRWKNGKVEFARVSNRATDQNGQYTFNNLTAGQYWMAAIPNFIRASAVRPAVTAGVIVPDQVFATQFYPGVDHFANASPITVASGQDVTGVNYHLPYLPQANLLGSIAGVPDGKPAITVALLPEIPGDSTGSFYLPLRTDRRQFELRGIAAGAYRLWAAAGGRRLTLDVQLNADENRIDVELPPGIAIRGTVIGVDPTATQYKNVQITVSPADGLPAQDFRSTLQGGTFDFGEIPTGKWSVEVSGLPVGTYLKSLRFGEQDVLGKPLILQPGSTGSLEIALVPNASEVTGTVEPAGPATILAAPRGELERRTTLYRTVQTNETGHFFFGDLAPGAYLFCALTDPEINAWQDPEFLPKIESFCKPVELKDGAANNFQLTMIGVPLK